MSSSALKRSVHAHARGGCSVVVLVSLLFRIEASEESRQIAAALRKKGDSFYSRAQQPPSKEERTSLLSAAKRMYVRALKLHAEDLELYKRTFYCCIQLEELAYDEVRYPCSLIITVKSSI